MGINDIIYVHIPKTGGWSMTKSLSEHGLTKLYGHDFSKTIKGKIGDEFDSKFKFTVVRNPWDRLLSTYSFLTNGSDIHRPPESKQFDTLGVKSFTEFVHKLYDINKGTDDVYLLPHDEGNRVNLFTLNQVNWILDDESGQLVDYVGKLSDLTKVITIINETNGLSLTVPPIGNTTKHGKSSDVYTTELVDMVSELYHKDITRFNFKFND